MALRDQPYIPLYVQDYLTDEKLNECGAASQGIYIKIICIMHKSEEYGVILLKQKDKQTDKQIKNFASKLSRLLTFNADEIHEAVKELTEEKVLTIRGDKLIQRRMVKDNEISEKRSAAGKKGGNNNKFAQAKTQANSEANSEDEYDNEIEINNKGENAKMTKVEAARIFYREQYRLAQEESKKDPHDKIPGSYATFILTLLNERKGKPNVVDAPGNHILQLPTQISLEQYKKLKAKCEEKGISQLELLDSWLNNTTYSKGKKSVYATLLNWANRRPDIERGTNLG